MKEPTTKDPRIKSTRNGCLMALALPPLVVFCLRVAFYVMGAGWGGAGFLGFLAYFAAFILLILWLDHVWGWGIIALIRDIADSGY